MDLFRLCLDFLYFVFSRTIKIIIFFLCVPYYHQVQYTIKHDFFSQIKFFKKYVPRWN